MAVATLTGLGGIQAQNPALAKIIGGLAGLPCGLLMVSRGRAHVVGCFGPAFVDANRMDL